LKMSTKYKICLIFEKTRAHLLNLLELMGSLSSNNI